MEQRIRTAVAADFDQSIETIMGAKPVAIMLRGVVIQPPEIRRSIDRLGLVDRPCRRFDQITTRSAQRVKRGPERVALAYTEDSRWRNRAEFFQGRPAIIEFLRRKWAKELECRLIKELWAVTDNRIAVRFQYEWRDDSGNWYRAHGNEQWEFDAEGLMRRREASINDVPIREADRLSLAARASSGRPSRPERTRPVNRGLPVHPSPNQREWPCPSSKPR